jgi:peptidoglycan/LPS O-acetylase OafA/YrhL
MPPTPRAPGRLDFLDAVRGAAALLVLLEHGLHHCFPSYLEFSKSHIVVGQAGILVFFMVSGFLIPKSLEEGKGNASFWLRRFFRLFPVYWFSIALGLGYVAFAGSNLLRVNLSDTTTWLANAALLQGWLNRPHVWDVYWSLHYEVGFYILCSVLFGVGLLNRVGPRSFAALLVGFALVFSFGYKLAGKSPGSGDLRLVMLAALFGFVCYRHSAGRLSRGTFYGLLAGAGAAVLVVWGVNHLWYPSAATVGQLARYAVLMGLGFGSFVVLFIRARNVPGVTRWLGQRCYPIYLTHPFVLVVLVPFHLAPWAFMPALVIGTLLVAEATHRLVERPGIALGRWLEKRAVRPAVATAAAVPMPDPAPLRRAA